MRDVETRGLVLYSQNHKEKDKLVKIFTESFGKRMFFVKNASKSRLTASLQNFTSLDLSATINDEGFSFINDIGDVDVFRYLREDIFANAYASYVVSLADAAVADNTYDPQLYEFLIKTLELLNEKIDKEILTNIFELQILSRFGASLNLTECVICSRRDLPMDFSFSYGGCLCSEHFSRDPRRLHLDPNILYLAGQFMEISIETLEKISVSNDKKKQLRSFIDALYDEYVGIQTKAKKFLDGMEDWSDLIKN